MVRRTRGDVGVEESECSQRSLRPDWTRGPEVLKKTSGDPTSMDETSSSKNKALEMWSFVEGLKCRYNDEEILS